MTDNEYYEERQRLNQMAADIHSQLELLDEEHRKTQDDERRQQYDELYNTLASLVKRHAIVSLSEHDTELFICGSIDTYKSSLERKQIIIEGTHLQNNKYRGVTFHECDAHAFFGIGAKIREISKERAAELMSNAVDNLRKKLETIISNPDAVTALSPEVKQELFNDTNNN